jgi:hypothetical protein
MHDLFLNLIQPFPFNSPFEINEDDLSDIKAQGLKHNLLILIYTQLQKYQKKISKNDHIVNFLEDLRPLYLKSITHSVKQEAIEKETIFLLRERDIPAVVIRGNEIAKEIYNDPTCRTSTDIDILIKISDALRVDSILSKNGYFRNDRINLKFWFYRIHHALYYYPGTNDLIEIHWNFAIPSFFKLTSEEIWNEVIYTDSGHLKLSPEMQLVMLLIHHHMHSFRELKILVDILWALYKYENVIDWHLFALKIRKSGLVKTTLIALNQLQSLWKETTAEILSIQILQNEFEKLRYKKPALLISFLKMDIDKHYSFQNYKDKIITRFALDNRSTIIFSFFKTLFPFPVAIKELYGDKRNWALPFNYMRFIKWRVKEWVK